MIAAPCAYAATAVPTCGNGIVDIGEECDPGSPLGSPECDTLCRGVDFEPPGLPFGLRSEEAASIAAFGDVEPRIYSPRLVCTPYDKRKNARHAVAARVRYRLHLCRNSQGQDSYTPVQVRAAMAKTAEEFAGAGIILEEESLVSFTENDCDMPFGDPSWEKALRANTPPGVLAIAFVSGITSTTTSFSVGGYCYFEGPLCVNAGAYPSLVIHEIGHFFGLAHTHECAYGMETKETCAESGDFLCDTPPDRGPLGKNGIASCEGGVRLNGSCSGACGAKICLDGSLPDSHDWMSYYHCSPGHFTEEQQDFMRCMLDNEMADYNADPSIAATTTTTLGAARCGDVTGEGDITASDALGVLRAGVGITECEPWICDYNGSGALTASDALAVLRAAVGMFGRAECPLPS
ncbi:MAG: hypothetical protein ABR587_06750 [Candidatus Binatia bacterium]